ncbi:MAG: dialkylresorcinol condensing enzyme DarA [Flavobacterium sp.]|nr:dialkylresorcinol condensing enzyme DarA [Flavobacterium sp.]
MKHVLVIHYSQSGQASEIARNLARPLIDDANVNVTFYQIEPEKPFPFPWTKETFFDVFPESFQQVPVALKPPKSSVLDKKYDLVIFSYQVWYLSPSIPANSFLRSDFAKQVLNNTPIVTIISCRNMWMLAQEKVKSLLKQNGAELKGNVVFVDRAGNLISVVTIVDWMFSGIKRKYLGIFPLPGVSKQDIANASVYGELILENLHQGDYSDLQSKVIANKGVYVSPYLVSVDKKGNFIFEKWSRFIRNRKKTRAAWLKVFYIYLFLAIWVISPIVFILHALTYPFTQSKRKKIIAYFQSV